MGEGVLRDITKLEANAAFLFRVFDRHLAFSHMAEKFISIRRADNLNHYSYHVRAESSILQVYSYAKMALFDFGRVGGRRVEEKLPFFAAKLWAKRAIENYALQVVYFSQS